MDVLWLFSILLIVILIAIYVVTLRRRNQDIVDAFIKDVEKNGYPVFITEDNRMLFTTPPEGAYEMRRTCRCKHCGEWIRPHYKEPFASCSCFDQEWDG